MKPRHTFGRIREQINENPRLNSVESFYLLENSHKLSRGFQQATSTENMFNLFYKIIFLLNKEKYWQKVKTFSSLKFKNTSLNFKLENVLTFCQFLCLVATIQFLKEKYDMYEACMYNFISFMKL